MGIIIGPIAKEYVMERDDNQTQHAELRCEAFSKVELTVRRKTSASQQPLF